MGGETKDTKETKKQASGHISEKVEDDIESLPKMEISQLEFLLKSEPDTAESITTKLMEYIKEHDMAPYYEYLCNEYQWNIDTTLLEKMKSTNKEQLEKCDEQLKDATENLGEIEVLEALFAKATYYTRIGDKNAAMDAFKEAGEKQQSINQKIQVVLHIIRIGLFFSDLELVEPNIEKAKQLIDEGGDWDRRNRLKVYESCYLLMVRDFKKASVLLQQSIATFTSVELMSYQQMIFYCVITSVLCTSRVELKKKIVDCPEVLAVIDDLPHLSDFLNGFYDCKYDQFFAAIVDLNPYITKDKYFATHLRYIYRELRVLAYSQFLEAYRSVKIESMASSFGISVPFLDSELSRFISAGRLNAKVDKVDGVIETNRPDAKNTQYQDIIKKGDHLLNRVQKLARVINI